MAPAFRKAQDIDLLAGEPAHKKNAAPKDGVLPETRVSLEGSGLAVDFVGDRLDVVGGAADGVAGGQNQAAGKGGEND
jgi:hypothetical protein